VVHVKKHALTPKVSGFGHINMYVAFLWHERMKCFLQRSEFSMLHITYYILITY